MGDGGPTARGASSVTINLRSRLRRIETKHCQDDRPLAAIYIRATDAEDGARQLAEHMAADTYRPSWPLIICQGATQP